VGSKHYVDYGIRWSNCAEELDHWTKAQAFLLGLKWQVGVDTVVQSKLRRPTCSNYTSVV